MWKRESRKRVEKDRANIMTKLEERMSERGDNKEWINGEKRDRE